MLSGLLALVVAAAFTGAAFYINFAEQPARLGLDDGALLAEWKPSYKSGFAMQATLAVFGLLLGVMAWWQTRQTGFLLAGLVLVANWPFTLLVIMPVNNRLMAIPAAEAGPRSRAMIEHWGRLHAVRTMLGAAATLLFLWTLS